MRRVLFVTAAIVAAVIFFALATLPPRPLAVNAGAIDPDLVRRTIRGAYHIHTTRSDGAADKATIAQAAARAGLKFIILTDHGDGTTPPDPSEYLSGVLCIDAVEISTNGGHYVALGMTPSPYPLGGDPSAVVEDVARLGGFGIAAHPDSPKASLAWTDWDEPIDGIEWLSADSEWRDETRTTLARAFVDYAFRPAPALASVLDRPVATLKRWDELTYRRRVVALAAQDAHGGIGRGVEESGARKPTLGHVPSYEASFRTFSDNVILDAPLSSDAADDGRRVLDAIRHGRVFTVVDAVATPGFIDMRAENGSISVRAAMPPGAEIVLVQNGRETQTATAPDVKLPILPDSTTARIEIRVAGAPGTPPVPWLVNNPVYYSSPTIPLPVRPAPGETVALSRGLTWHVEKDPGSVAMVTGSGGPYASLQYELAPGAKTSQFAALAGDIRGRAQRFTHLLFVGSAARPSRVSVQLRYGSGERWGSSVYLDSTAREIDVPIARTRPLDRQDGPAPDPSSATSLLFVADLTNAKPGDSNTFTIANLRTGR